MMFISNLNSRYAKIKRKVMIFHSENQLPPSDEVMTPESVMRKIVRIIIAKERLRTRLTMKSSLRLVRVPEIPFEEIVKSSYLTTNWI